MNLLPVKSAKRFFKSC